MGDLLNVLTSKNADKITTNRHSDKKEVKVYFLPQDDIAIEAWEDYKYIYWLSRTKRNDKILNSEIFDLVCTDGYDYVGYSYKIQSALGVSSLNNYYYISYPLKDCSLNGNAFAEDVIRKYNEAVQKCIDFEQNTDSQRYLANLEKRIDDLHGSTDSAAYRAIQDDMKFVWNSTYLRLSPNSKMRERFESVKASLASIYNAEMTRIR